VGTNHIHFQLVYGLHALMLIEYLLPMTNSVMFQGSGMKWVLSTQLFELETLEESHTFH
jgi:hypothetical protein